MIHMKSLIRRLAGGSWLLAAGLVLGWAGVASAVEVTLSLDQTKVREDVNKTVEITAKVKVAADAAADIVVPLSLVAGDGADAQNERYRIILPTITIPKGKKEAVGTISFTPINDKYRGGSGPTDRYASATVDDLSIGITGNVGSSHTLAPSGGVTLTLIDDDKISTSFDLSFSPGDLSNEAGQTSVVVTGALNGSLSGVDRSYTLALRNPASITLAQYNAAIEPDAADVAAKDTLVLTRDSDYSATAATLNLRKKRVSGKATITIDPKETKAYDAYIAVEPVGPDTLKGIDLNLDGDTGDTFSLTFSAAQNYVLNEGSVYASVSTDAGLDIGGDGTVGATTPVEEWWIGVDLTLDGSVTGATNFYSIASCNQGSDATLGATAATTCTLKEADLKFVVSRPPAFFKIKDAPLADVKSDGLTATPSMVRENAGRTEIELKVTLKAAVTSDQRVRFTVLTTGCAGDFNCAGRRDIDYTVDVSDLTIPSGETSATTTLVLTPVDNDGAGGSLGFQVTAQVGAGDTAGRANITIVDDETLTDNITLSVSPAELKAESGQQDVTVTGTLNGKVFDEDVTVNLVISRDGPDENTTADANAAQRDTDYTASVRSLTIPAGQVSGTTTVFITPLQGGDKKIFLRALKSPVKNDDDEDVTVSTATITLKNADAAATPTAPGALSFGTTDLSSTVFTYTAGTAIEPEELPEAEGGEGEKTYSVSATLPAGLSFDAATRTITGTPTTAGTSKVVYTVIDSKEGGANSAAMTFTIEVNPAPAPTVAVASVSSTHSSVRENGETTTIAITATLASASEKAETIRFTIVGPSSGTPAVRDVDYTAAIGGSVVVAAGDLQGSTRLDLTPINNDAVDGNKYFGVQASASGGSAQTDIKIADDETPSTSVSLSASPHTLSEDAAVTEVTLTATLDGKVLDEDAVVTIAVDPNSAATRDVDYSALFNPLLTIAAGSTSGSAALLIDPTADTADEGNETITLTASTPGLTSGSAQITISDHTPGPPPPGEEPLAFAEGASVDDQQYTAGTAIADMVLPEASVGTGDITYSVSELPAGLSFDADTRTISGTPEAASDGAVEVTYTATAGEATVTLTFSITVNAALDTPNLMDLFGLFQGAGKANPATNHEEDGVIRAVVGESYTLTLPEVMGGTPPLTYSVSGLPAGLSFDPATRTISGTPDAVTDGSVEVTYTVTDAAGASSSVPFNFAVVPPSLDAPDAVVAQDYTGADGSGDQGGFVLLTWDLSADHATLDGYRVFREMPALGGEMMPWAMVDAVPGVSIARAIVATLDNAETNWGIAAERGNLTTHGAAKAAFVRADAVNHAYEQMAETLLASREAAQAGDAPVFAALLPEALAFAEGVAPKFNLVAAGTERSALTITEEAVRAIDNIAPVAVPTLQVLDAPGDAGGRIALTWALSPSDQLLQGVVAGALGPAAASPVAGVHGYGIYRQAAGSDEFVLVGRVGAGATSFVDETALNGVRYTYQVRAYDADNETASVEQTALAVRNQVVDSEGRVLYGLFGADNRVGFDDFFLLADMFGLTAEDPAFDPAFDLVSSAQPQIDFDDFFVFADNFGRSTGTAAKRVPMQAGLNADARLYLAAQTALPSVGEDFVLDVRLADFVEVQGYGLQVQYEADKLTFVEVSTDRPLGGGELASPQVLSDAGGVLTLAAHGEVLSDGEVGLHLVFRAATEIENTVVEITASELADGALAVNRLALPVPVSLQTRPEVFSLVDNYPNPFNPATTIRYALPQAADVELTVYNVVGQPVRTLVAEAQSAGRYVVEWDATDDRGYSVSSGMYFYRLQAGDAFRQVKKMLLLK